ncbi:MAG: glycoside hydrolase family 13 protein [Clostridiales Family XIII bacterium]|jgi:glycosidase|nr:glycoside hydrolase family 13 protein [Clostridiales Family XIII bacterium]
MNEIFAGGVTISDSLIVHESAKERYRSPFGAVPAGSTVKLALRLSGVPYQSVWLTVYVDDMQTDHEMLMNPEYARAAGPGYEAVMDDETESVFKGTMFHAAVHTPDHACVVWYWFRVDMQDGSHIYYGAEVGNNAGVGKVFPNPPTAFQLTVYEPGFKTPDWAKSAIMYQIFPDRFRRGAENRVAGGLEYHHSIGRTDMSLHESWDEPPAYLPADGSGRYMPLDLFGGDIPGITEALLYLKEFGVSLIYLNPIFEAYSNHRYNTADYLKIDPALGTDEDFEKLIERAGELGIRVILDGVFSHTGDDSAYFNKYGRYDGLGAYQSVESPYYGWYTFSDYPEHYRSWWGFDTLPEINEELPDWIDFIIEGEDSVFNTWARRGAAGFRLDVADELPDDTIERMRRALKAANPDAFLLGEVWEDATTKQSYNVGRRYALGAGLDSVMNYPFASCTKNFLLGNIDASAYMRFLVSQSQNYPKEMYYALMNLLSSHDIARVRTVLATGVDGSGMSREAQAAFTVSAEDDARGDALVRCAAALQYSLPGIPVIYYGDEAGLHGLLDPFNRGTFPVDAFGDGGADGVGCEVGVDNTGRDGDCCVSDGCEKKPGQGSSLASWYRDLGALHSSRRALRTGHALYYSTNGDVIGILRYCLGRVDAFGAPASDEMLLTVVNPDAEPRRMVIDLHAEKECLSFMDLAFMCALELTQAVRLLSSCGSSASSCADAAVSDTGSPTDAQTIPITQGLLDISVPPYCAEIFEIEWDRE